MKKNSMEEVFIQKSSFFEICRFFILTVLSEKAFKCFVWIIFKSLLYFSF